MELELCFFFMFMPFQRKEEEEEEVNVGFLISDSESVFCFFACFGLGFDSLLLLSSSLCRRGFELRRAFNGIAPTHPTPCRSVLCNSKSVTTPSLGVPNYRRALPDKCSLPPAAVTPRGRQSQSAGNQLLARRRRRSNER